MTHITFAERYGREEGVRQMLPLVRQLIEFTLQTKFGAGGGTELEVLVKAVRAETDPDVLQQVVDALDAGSSLDDLRSRLT